MRTDEGTTEDWEGRLGEYLLGAMDSGEVAEFEQQLEECRAHVRLTRQYTEVVGWLAHSVPPSEPPAGHKERLLARISVIRQERASTVPPAAPSLQMPVGVDDTEQELPAPSDKPMVDLGDMRARRRGFAPLPALAAAAAAVLLFVLGWGWLQAQQQLDRNANTLNIPPGFRAVAVQGQGDYGEAGGVALINPETHQAVLVAEGLTPLSPDQVYELWLLYPEQGRDPAPAGTFNAAADGSARPELQVPPGTVLRDYVGVAVTIEPAPGTTKATGPLVLVGQWQ